MNGTIEVETIPTVVMVYDHRAIYLLFSQNPNMHVQIGSECIIGTGMESK